MAMLDSERSENTLQKIRKALFKSRDWKVKIFLPNTQVPLLRVVYKPYNLECDIVASNGISVSLSEIMRYLNTIQPKIVNLYHYVRISLNMGQIKMKRYVVYLLVLFYLQRKRLMPSIELAQKNIKKERIDGKLKNEFYSYKHFIIQFNFILGWEIQFDEDRSLEYYKIKRINNYLDFAEGFFRFYANFDFSKHVLSIYSGSSIEKTKFKHENFKIEKPLCIVGPFDLDRNSGQMIGVKTLEEFKKVCKATCEFLSNQREE